MATFAQHDTTYTVVYSDGGDGWITATIAEEPAAISQGRTREEARENALQALHDLRRDSTTGERLAERLDALYHRAAGGLQRLERLAGRRRPRTPA
jgi:hypothetical protein